MLKKIHMIGNAHLDPVWLWRWQEGFQETKATFQSVLDRMEEYDDFTFTSSSAAFYEWIEHNDESMFQKIKQRIQEGRWIICGGWWIQPDCNLPGPESFARQGLIGQRYFREKFGVTAKVGYNVDSFGHHGMLPQILQQSGMDAYVFMRPNPEEKGLPARLFLWESSDGSRVKAFRIPFEYATFDHMENHIMHCKTELKNSFNRLMCFYGVGNHGGGPTKENIETIKKMADVMEDAELVFSSPNHFFDEIAEIEDQLPIVHDDLQHHASGCYSVHSEVKKYNRYSENILIKAEKFSSIAKIVTKQKYPDDFNKAWKGVLFNQFHDILAGTSIEAAYEDARDLYGEVNSIASRALNDALQSISWNINIDEEKDMKPIVVFNPHSWSIKKVVEIEYGIFDNYRLPDEFIIEDVDGNEIPYQYIEPLAKIPNRKRVAFMAEVPALGYRTYKLRAIKPKQSFSTVKADDHVLENDRIRVKFNPNTGGISSLYDKKMEVEVFRADAAVPVVMEDLSDAWGHGKLHFNKKIGEFTPVDIKKIEEGPVRATIRVTSKYEASTIVQDFTLYKDMNKVDVNVKVNWQEKYKTLKIKFPVAFDHRKVTYEIPFGHIQREANGEEEPMQNWVDVTGRIDKTSEKIYGLSVLNDGKYSGDVDGDTIHLTVLRSPIYAHHIPYEPDLEEDYPIIDQGIQTFTYSLLPHENSWEEARTVNHALELNQRAEVVVETYHKGELPQEDSFIHVDQEHVVLTAMKKAEDNDDLILRFYESAGQSVTATITLPLINKKFTADFGRSEIKTFRVPLDKDEEIIETNMLEDPIQEQ